MLPNSRSEHFRRSLRLVVGVFVPCVLGFAILGPLHVSHSAGVKSACKWMAITGALVTHPLIGRASAIGSEQIVGTAVGGAVGYVLHRFGQEFLGEVEDGLFLASVAALLAGLSVSLGERMDNLTNIFIVTVLLSAFPVDSGQEHKMQYYGIARICGILLGVLMTLVLSVLIFPKSATVESLHDMDDALKYLCHLHACVWKPCGFSDDDDEVEDNDDLEALLLSSRRVSEREAHHRHMENSVTQLYGHLFDMQSNLDISRSELLLYCTSNNHMILVPKLFVWCGPGHAVSSPLPIQSLNEMANSVRRVSRGFFTIEQALNDWFEVLGEERMSHQAESGVLKSITVAMRNVLFEIRTKFPLDRNLNPLLLLELIRVVKEWESMGQLTSLESLQKYRQFSNTLDGLERRASLVLRDTFDVSLLEDSGSSTDEDQSTRPKFGVQKEYSQELLSFSFALKCLVVDVGILWNTCEDVMAKLPFT